MMSVKIVDDNTRSIIEFDYQNGLVGITVITGSNQQLDFTITPDELEILNDLIKAQRIREIEHG